MDKLHFRNELKYYISYLDYLKLRSVLKATMQMDANVSGDGYLIKSLYYDDLIDTALYEKNAGVLIRKKFRIRAYDNKDDVIKLERKRKVNQKTNKDSFNLSREQYDKILSGDIDFMRTQKNDVAQEFYILYKTQWLRPKVMVEYVREAYIMRAGNVRITFDKQLRGSSNLEGLFVDTLGRNMVPDDTMILEVKFDEFLPEQVRDYLTMVDKKPLSISKYVICREALVNNKWSVQ